MQLILAASESPFGFLSEFGVEWQLLVSQGLSFAIVAAALYYFVFRPVSRVAQQRRDEIQKGLDDAKRAAEELGRAQKDSEAKIAEAVGESAKILKDARAEAKAVVERALAQASEKAEELLKKNEAAIAAEKAKMRDELKAEIAALAVNAARKAVDGVLTSEQRAKLAELAAEKLEI